MPDIPTHMQIQWDGPEEIVCQDTYELTIPLKEDGTPDWDQAVGKKIEP